MFFKSLLVSILIILTLSLPDLTLDQVRMQRSAYIDYQRISADSCAIGECGTGVGRRLLLRFDGAIPNVGTTDLYFGRPSTQSRHGFVWDSCHRHYHYNHFMDYQVFEFDNYSNPDPIMTGDKRAFCLRDDGFASRRILSQYNINPSRVRETYDCDNQGIHVGYQDVYGRELECQWIDVTDLEPGMYKMRAEVNPSKRFEEESYDNNVAWIEFERPGGDDDDDDDDDDDNYTPRPTPRPTDRPVTNDDDDDSCLGIGETCRWSSSCCGSSFCRRERFGGDRVCRYSRF